MDELAHVGDIMRVTGWKRSSTVSHFVREGVIAPPTMVLGADRRWRHAWPREYVDRLISDPPPRLRARLSRAAQ